MNPLPTGIVLDRLTFDEPASAGDSYEPRAAPTESAVAGDAQVRQWLLALTAVRDAIGRLPKLPIVLWGAGLAVVVAVQLIQVVQFRLKVRKARPADAATMRLVAGASAQLGVATPPEAMVVPIRISPLLWCGLRRTLYLPSNLWAELDDVGRRAVVLHEMAHLHRRDHWVRWIELVVGALFWWNPVVWWVRRRIDAEADHCCDAWVTHLLPGRRREYAETLLKTKQYISESGVWTPAIGMGVTSARASRFARRLTMVMTDPSTPRQSLSGMFAAIALVALAWIATPAQSCPPEEESKADETCTTTVRSALPPVAPLQPVLPTLAAPDVPAHIVTAPPANRRRTRSTGVTGQPGQSANAALGWLTNPPGRGQGGSRAPGAEHDPNARLDRLEHQMAEVTARLDEIAAALHGQRPGGRFAPSGGAGRSVTVPARRSPFSPEPVAEGEVVKRSYRLPRGKLEALTALMARDDVPIFISAGDDEIEVNATPAQHEIFQAFVDMIHPAEGRGGGTPAARPDPLAMRAGPRITGIAEALRAIQPQVAEVGRELLAVSYARRAELEAQREALQATVEALTAEAERLGEEADSLDERAEESEHRDEARALRQQAREIRRQAEQLEAKVSRMEADFERLEARLEELQEREEEEAEAAEEPEHDHAR